jgi:hypothetical protein
VRLIFEILGDRKNAASAAAGLRTGGTDKLAGFTRRQFGSTLSRAFSTKFK